MKRISFFIKKEKLVLFCTSKKITLQYINSQNSYNMPLQKHIKLLSFLILLAVGSIAEVHSEKLIHPIPTDSTRTNYVSENQIPLTDSIINYGKLFMNTRYRHGSSSSTGFDCSGFTSFVYRNFGYNLSHSSSEQANQVGTIDRCELKTGDLVFFAGRRKSKRVGHVGIVVSADQDGRFNFIHASTQNGVIISSSEEPYYLQRYIKAGRVITDNHLVAVAPVVSNQENKSFDYVSGTQMLPVTTQVRQITKLIPAEYHRVKKGETLSTIAHKYGMTLAELKRKNNIKGNKINPKQRIKIKDAESVMLAESIQPQTEEKKVELANNQTNSVETKVVEPKLAVNQFKTEHIVQKGETLFGISKLYNMTVDELKRLNNMVAGKIRYGQKLILTKSVQEPKPVEPVKAETAPVQEVSSKPTVHNVTSGETLFSIAKKYDISVADLKKINHLTTNKIKFGQKLKLVQSSEPKEKTPSEKAPKLIHHKVKSGESFYSIAKTYGCKVEELKNWNKKSGSKIKAGEKLIVYQKAD